MEQPTHDLRTHVPTAVENTGRRTIILIGVGILHVGLIWALVVGLASGLVQKGIEEIKAEVVKPVEDKKPPPPPPPDLAHPPPPFVPMPELNIATDVAPTTSIVTTVNKPTQAPPISSPASIGRAHSCDPHKYYSDVSIRMNEKGTTSLAFSINADGTTSDFHVTSSSGSDRLDQATIECVGTWRYKPAVQNGQPVKVPWETKIVWQLK
jgi:protein TonB